MALGLTQPLTEMSKQSHYRPGQAQSFLGVWGSQISIKSAHKGGNVISPMHRPPLPSRKYSWYSFQLEAESNPRAIVWQEGLCQWKIPIHHRESKPQSSDLNRSASTNCATSSLPQQKWGPAIYPGGEGGRCVGLITLPPPCADCLEILEPQTPGTIRACPGL
jgi:hypothetical protein